MFFRGILLIPITACALRLIGLQSTRRLLGLRARSKAVPATPQTTTKWRVADAAVRMTEAASRHGVMRGNCLSKSMVILHLLQRQGIDAVVHVGGRKEGKSFEAHAWVEMDGSAVNDFADVRQRFALFRGQVSSALTREK